MMEEHDILIPHRLFDLHEVRGVIYTEKGDYERALAELEAAAEACPWLAHRVQLPIAGLRMRLRFRKED